MITDIRDLIGKTPLVKLGRISGNDCTIIAKLESMNPSGSIKDVMALYMMEIAEKQGLLKPGSMIIEATSGNTGISFAMLSRLRGYKFIAIMPEYMSRERRQMMSVFGAEIVLTPTAEGFSGTIKKLEELSKEYPDAWLPRQFDNPDNITAHKTITGKNIVQELNGNVDAFVAGVGTGGTLMGVGQALREVNPEVKIIAVEPAEAAVMSGGEFGHHKIQGIGPGFIPEIIDLDSIDEVITVDSDEAMDMARRLIREEGLMVGISSGANIIASQNIAGKLGQGKTVVTVLADRAERYISMDLLDTGD
jgi:cysteine synthase A